MSAVQAQVRVFRAAFGREVALESDHMGLKFLLSLLEPVFHILVVCVWHWLVRVMPLYGTSKVLFIASGLYPVFVFIHVSASCLAISKLAPNRRRFPAETLMDVIIAKVALKLFAYCIVGVVLFGGVYIFVTPQAMPWDFGIIASAMTALAVLGLGVGLCSVAIATYFPLWRHIYGPIARALILFSGVLFVPDYMPTYLRDYLAWNPVLHGVDLFRQGFYPSYPMTIYSPQYLWGCAFGLLVCGLCAMRPLRYDIRRPI